MKSALQQARPLAVKSPPQSVRTPSRPAVLIGFQHDPRLDREELGPDAEIGTSIAARLLCVSPRTVRAYCDEGVLLEGSHWRRNTERSPYFIRRRAVIAKRKGLI